MDFNKAGDNFEGALSEVVNHVRERFSKIDNLPVVPTPDSITSALSSLPKTLPETGLGSKGSVDFILDHVTQGLWQGHAGPRMYGFVIGGVTPAAQLADILVGSYDEQVQVALPQATISVALEQLTADMVLDLLDIPRNTFAGKTITTGATASNILGITCGRDALLLNSPHLPPGYSIAENGFPPHISTPQGPMPPIQIITVKAHGSILKSAAVTGIGRANVLDGSRETVEESDPWGLGFDLVNLEQKLERVRKAGGGVIVAIALGEVNTGGFTPDVKAISDLCKKHGAWLHIDAAFGGCAAVVPEWAHLKEDMMLADSLVLDAHKWLNAPYDTALFFTRRAEDLRRSFGPSAVAGIPAYLTPAPLPVNQLQNLHEEQLRLRTWQAGLDSPLNNGIENSRRARALPLFAALMENGKNGYVEIIQRNIDFARDVAAWISASPAFEVLNLMPTPVRHINRRTQHGTVPINVVLFRGSMASSFPPDDPTSGARLVAAINETRIIYVTGTKWDGKGAVRLAVSNWRTARNGDQNKDFEAVVKVLSSIAGGGITQAA